MIFLIPYFLNIGTRFLIPALPFISVSLASVIAGWRPLAAVLIIVHAVLAWPAVLPLYCNQYAWRLESFPWKAALRVEPEESYLRRIMSYDYDIGLLLEKHVPPGEMVFSPRAAIQRSYHSRDVVVGYQSALGNRLRELLWTPLFPHLQPAMEYTFRVDKETRRIRIVQTGKGSHIEDRWSINEIRITGGRGASRLQWSAGAFPNNWDVSSAVDGNRATRWSTWETFQPGMYAEATFGGRTHVDSVVVTGPADQASLTMRVEYEDHIGRIMRLPHPPDSTVVAAQADLRQMAAAAVKKAGVRWIVLAKDDHEGKDFQQNSALWGASLIATDGQFILYRLN